MLLFKESGWRFWWLALLVLVVDQLTKVWVIQSFSLGESIQLLPVFNFTYARNYGAAFSFLGDAGGWQRWLFVGIGVVATLLIVWQLRKNPDEKMFCLSLSSILGGAIGNVVDRLQHGYVVDFLDFFWGSSHFPAFNVADMGITLGAILLILDEILRARRAKPQA